MSLLIWILSIGIALFQVADYWTTMKVLERGGHEDNPFMRMLFKGFGMNLGLLLGKFYVVIFVIVGAILGWFDDGFGLGCLILLFAVYGWVVNHNLKQYEKGKCDG